MRPAAQNIILDGKTFTIRPLNMAQVRDVEIVLLTKNNPTPVAEAIEVLKIGLRRDHLEAVDTIEEMEAVGIEIAAAARVIYILGGFIQATPEDQPGEKGAA